MEQPKKPKFDPNKAYDVVDSKKPAFNPDMPFEPVKKKDNTTSTSTTQKGSSDLAQRSGSLDSPSPKYRLPNDYDFTEMQRQGKLPKDSAYSKPKFNEKEVYDLDTKGKVILPSDKQVKKNEDSIIELNKIVGRDSRRATDLELNNFKNSTSLTPQEIEEKKKEVDDEINKNGFWNTAKDYGKKALNVLSSSVARMTDEEGLDKELHISTDPLSDYKQEFINKQKENGVDTSKLSKEDVFSGAKNLLIKDKKDKLKEDKTSLYIDSLSDDEKNALNLTKLFKRETLNEKDKVYLANTEISKQEIENTNSEIKRIVDKFNKKEDLSESEVEFAKNYEENAKKLAKEYDENYIKYQKNNSELGDVAQEYDLLKRDYDITRKSLATIGGRSAQILYGLATVSNDILNPYEESRIAINDKLAEANSKVNDLLENKYQKNTEGWNGIGDAFEYVANIISNQLPNLALMAVTGGSSQAIPLLAIGAYSAGNNINDLTQSNNEGKTFYSEDQIRKYAYIEGAGEMLETGTMGNLVRFNKFMKASFNNPQTRELFLKTTKESLANSFKLVGKGLVSENAEELGTMWIDIIAKEKFLGVKTSKKEIADLTERTMKDTSTMSILMSATPQIAHQVIKSITPKSYVENLDKNTKEILRLNNELKKTNLTKEESDIIKKSLDNKISENKKMLENVLDRNKNLDDEQRKKAIELELSTSELRNEAKSVKKSTSIDKDVKIKLLKDLETEYKKQEALREKISSGSSTILDVVSEEEKNKLKSNALKVLLKENPNSNEANFTNVKIEEKAIEIYKSENKSNEKQNETTITEQIVETQPQARKSDIEKTKYRIAELNNELEQNRISLEKGEMTNRSSKDIKNEIAELESKLPKESVVTLGVSESFNKAGENAKSKQDGKVIGRWILDNSKVGDTITISDGTGYEITNSKNGEIEITPFETNEKGDREYVREGVRLVTENQLKQGDLFETSYTNSKGDRVTEKYTYNEAEVPQQAEEQEKVAEVVSESNNNQISKPNENKGSQKVVAENPNSNQIKKPTIVVHGAVNGFGLQYAEGIDEKDVVAPKDGRGFLPQEQQKLLNEYKSVIEKDVVLEDGSKSISIITPSADNFGRSATNTFEFVIPKGNKSTTKGIQSILDNVTKSDLKGKEVIDESVKQVKEYINSNETTSPSNIEPNADVRPRNESMGEMGIEQKPTAEVVAEESVQSANDVRKPKTEIEHALNEIDKGILLWSGDMGSPRIDLGMSWADIRKGESDLKKGKINSVPAKRLLEALKKAKEEGGYRYKFGTGSNRKAEFVTFEDLERVTNEVPLTNLEIEEINKNEEQLAKEYDDYFNSLDEQTQNEILENYENKPTEIVGDSEVGESKNDVSNEEKPTKKTAEERIKIANAKVDDIANAVKGIDNIFGIKIKVENIDGLNKNGIDIVDVIANIVKQAIEAGINVDEAIRKTIDHLKQTIDFDIDENLVKEKLGIGKPQDFEPTPGKKSVLGRMASGNNSVIKQAIAKYSLDYEIENQKEAKQKAEMFVEDVGYKNALDAVRKGLIDGAQGAFIYAKAIEVLEQEINTLKGEYKLDAIADYQELLGQISDELDNRSRSNGRFIAALAEIYNSSGGRYNLTKMVNDYKAKNNGTISKEVLEKLKNVEEKLKESESKLADLEAKKRIEEENDAFNNILESVARKKRINTNAKITDRQKAKAFADKLRSFKISNNANLSAATPFSIAYDLAIETAAKALELSGLISDAIKAGVDSIRNAKLSKDEQEQALSDLFDLFDDSDVNTGQKGSMSIDENGKLRIPHSLIREKVENGIDNIDDLVSELISDAQELFPELDITERQVRDIVTGYGKVANPTIDEIETQISIMKSLGRIASGLEDANKGQRPLRSGQQRREPTMKERTEMKKLKALLRDLPLADADIKKAYKTALDSIKKRLSNEIEELDDQIAKGEKRKGEKSVIEYDQEAKDLKAIRDSKKQQLDDLVGKPELTDEQKIDRAEKTLQKRLDDLEQKIANNEIDYAKKREKVTSTKLEDMRKAKSELENQIKQMRIDSGLAEERLIEIAKRNASKRLQTLKDRIANKDFEKRVKKPNPTDVELNKIKSEIEVQKEIFDKEVYKIELQNRKWEQKALDLIKDVLSVPKILSFTADLSFVGIQNVTQVWKMGSNSIVHLAKTGKLKGAFRDSMIKTFKAMASPNFEQKYMQSVKANPNYKLWKDSKLGIVESHYKESAKAEVFQHNLLTTLFDILGNYVASKGYEKSGNIIKDYVNIISVFERGQTVFENQMRINRFEEGAGLLKAQGLNPIDDIQEYKKVAAAVNTLTGRANTGSVVASALREFNGTVFSSFSNWAAGVNQLNPYWYYTLTPTARKMALTDVAHHIVGAGAMISMASLYALGQDDDTPEEDKVTIETSPTSSDFAQIKIGNLRIDPWAGKKTTVVAFARLINGGKINKYGDFKKYGIEYDDENWIDLPIEYAGNKIAPGPRFALDRFFGTKKVEYKGNSFRENKYGEDFKESKYLVPLIFDNFKEVNKEQPNLFGKVTMALSWTGLINTNVYGGFKEGLKDMPDDIIEQQYKVKIQKIKDNEAKLESNIEKLAKEYTDNKVDKIKLMEKVDEMVMGDPEMYNNQIESLIKKVNKEQVKGLITDAFYIGLKKEKNPEAQAIMYYSQFKDDSGMTKEQITERDNNLRLIEFDFDNQKFIDAYRELLKSKK